MYHDFAASNPHIDTACDCHIVGCALEVKIVREILRDGKCAPKRAKCEAYSLSISAALGLS